MAAASESTAGRVIGERYRIESLLGSGGMGVLYAAEHLLTRRRVAIKLLHPSREADLDQVRARFLSEARAASAVRHPHVVDVLDMGTDDDDSPFLVMELLEGESLDRMILREGRLTPEQTLAAILPIMGALSVLHDAGIVHRDVKPSNIFLCRAPTGRLEPKLLDFGLARMASDSRLTRSGVVIGTPLYMAPEHAAGAPVGPPCDVWSMGVVLFECLSGTGPYSSTDGAVVAAQVMAGRTRALSEVCVDVPEPLALAIEGALKRDLGRRYRDMREFARALLWGARASSVLFPSDPDPIGLPDFYAWSRLDLEAPTETSSPNMNEAHARATFRPSLTPGSRWLALGLTVVILLSIATTLWLFAHATPQPRERNATATEETVRPSAARAREPERPLDEKPSSEPAPARVPPAASNAAPSLPDPAPTREAPRLGERSVAPPSKRPARKMPAEPTPVPERLDVETEWK